MKDRKEQPITIRAMLAADCSALPSELRHLIHVLALHANNVTGRGLTGQARLAEYVGCTDRHIRRLLAKLDALWATGASPVGLLREKRWLTSDAYQLVVREGARLKYDRTPRSANNRTYTSGLTGHPGPDDRTYRSNQPDTQVRNGGVNRTPRSYNLHSGSTEPTVERSTEDQHSQGGHATAGASASRKPEATEAQAAERNARLARRIAATRGR